MDHTEDRREGSHHHPRALVIAGYAQKREQAKEVACVSGKKTRRDGGKLPRSYTNPMQKNARGYEGVDSKTEKEKSEALLLLSRARVGSACACTNRMCFVSHGKVSHGAWAMARCTRHCRGLLDSGHQVVQYCSAGCA